MGLVFTSSLKFKKKDKADKYVANIVSDRDILLNLIISKVDKPIKILTITNIMETMQKDITQLKTNAMIVEKKKDGCILL